jgi:parvulin-like peptidyl-prolyl isomerase
VLTVAVSFVGCSRDRKKDENTLAIIGSRVISKKDFSKRYEDFCRRTGGGVQDNLEVRRQVLHNYVDEELLILAAEKRGYVNDREGRHERERLEIQELLNAFNRDFIARRVVVSEGDLKHLFVRLNTKVKARHLHAPTKLRADSLYAALQHGASFEALAKSVFTDPVLRDSGGDLGYFTVDEMEPAFEEVAYALKIGEISKPVRTSDGYSIIRVDARVTNPLLTEHEYAKHRDKLEGYWRVRKVQAATVAYVDSLGKALDIAFNEPIVQKLFTLLKSRHRDEISAAPENFSNGELEFANEELVRSKLGVWEVTTFQEKARFTSEKQQEWIRSEAALKEFITGLVARDSILAQAKKAGLHRQPQYKEKIAEKFDIYLLERMEESLRRETQIPEDSLRNYHHKYAGRFAEPGEVNLREIVLRDKARAEQAAAQLKNGASFAALAKKYSVRRESAARGGELGYLKPADFGRWADLAFSLKVGEQVGPVQMDSMYVLLECIGKRPSRARSFEEARAEVEQTLRMMYWDNTRATQIDGIRKTTQVAVFPERLKTMRLN